MVSSAMNRANSCVRSSTEMKAEWCKGDYCTLLSGGSGFGGSEYGGDYVESPKSAAEAASILKEAGIDQ